MTDNKNIGINKAAFPSLGNLTPNQLKWLKIFFGTTLASAGATAIARQWRQDEKSKERRDVNKDRNKIEVVIDTDNFLRDLPKPKKEEEPAAPEQTKELPAPAEVPLLAGVDADANKDESIEDIKRRILKEKTRSFSPFGGKLASCGSSCSGSKTAKNKPAVKGEAPNNATIKPKVVTAESTIIKTPGKKPRDEAGRFVNPDAKIKMAQSGAIAQTIEDVLQGAANLFGTTKDTVSNAAGTAAGYIGGGLAGIYAVKGISHLVNKIRAKKAKKRLEESQKKYIKALTAEHNEESDPWGEISKSAQASGSPTPATDNTLAWMAGGVMLPFVTTALLTYKLLENRRKAKKEGEKLKRTFPEEPLVLYKTSEDKCVPVRFGSVLALVDINRKFIEMEESRITKKAGERWDNWARNRDEYGFLDGTVRTLTTGLKDDDYAFDDAHVNQLADTMSSGQYDKLWQGVIEGDETAKNKLGDAIAYETGIKDRAKIENIAGRMLQHPKVQDHFISNMNDEKNKWWYDKANQGIEKSIQDKYGDGVLGGFMSWLAKTFPGFARGLFGDQINAGIRGQFTEAAQGILNPKSPGQQQMMAGSQKNSGGQLNKAVPPAPGKTMDPAQSPFMSVRMMHAANQNGGVGGNTASATPNTPPPAPSKPSTPPTPPTPSTPVTASATTPAPMYGTERDFDPFRPSLLKGIDLGGGIGNQNGSVKPGGVSA